MGVWGLKGSKGLSILELSPKPKSPTKPETLVRSPCTSEWDGEDIGPRTVLLHVTWLRCRIKGVESLTCEVARFFGYFN